MTLATTVSYTRRLVETENFSDTATAQIAAGATSMTVGSATDWKEGDTVEEQGAGERFLVTADGSGSTVTIRKGHANTTDGTVPSGTVLWKDPTYKYNQIVNAITEVVNGLGPDIWITSTTTITPSTSADIYDLPTDYEGFIELYHAAVGSITEVRRAGVIEEIRSVPTATLSSGKGLRIRGWHRIDTAATLTYRAHPTTTNMPDALERIVARGAAGLLKYTLAGQHSTEVETGEQSRVRNLLQTGRFDEDLFNRELFAYRAKLTPASRWVRRYGRRRFIGTP